MSIHKIFILDSYKEIFYMSHSQQQGRIQNFFMVGLKFFLYGREIFGVDLGLFFLKNPCKLKKIPKKGGPPNPLPLTTPVATRIQNAFEEGFFGKKKKS